MSKQMHVTLSILLVVVIVALSIGFFYLTFPFSIILAECKDQGHILSGTEILLANASYFCGVFGLFIFPILFFGFVGSIVWLIFALQKKRDTTKKRVKELILEGKGKPKNKSIKILICVALCCSLLAIIGVFFSGVFFISVINETQNEALKQVFPGKYQFYISEPDKYHVWYYYEIIIDGQKYISNENIDEQTKIIILDPESGREYDLLKTKIPHYKTGPEYSAKSLGQFEVDRKKILQIEVVGAKKPITLSISRINLTKIMFFALKTLFSLAFSVVFGVITILLIKKRKRHFANIQSAIT